MTAVAEPFESSVGSHTRANVIPFQPAASAAPADVFEHGQELEVDPLRDVALASARLERLQWEMDAAEEDFCAALKRATTHSVSAPALARAAGVTLPELETYLHRPAPETPAATSPFSIVGF